MLIPKMKLAVRMLLLKAVQNLLYKFAFRQLLVAACERQVAFSEPASKNASFLLKRFISSSFLSTIIRKGMYPLPERINPLTTGGRL